MARKICMHPKNIYNTPPDFKELAISYPEFRKYVKQELSGRANIDYSDSNAVKELCRVLLERDFNLDVDIDASRLIPRVPLCLNYLLWVEDLLMTLEKKPPDILGIDIGTGGVCIYSLLAARKGWKMLATEIDKINFKNAENNVRKNNLENFISLKLVSDPDQILEGVLDEHTQYDFCMCNPPFFSFNEKPQNRTSRRQQLNTTASEIQTEISTEGGEISFLRKLIQESMRLRGRVKVYTTLVGKKCDFTSLKKELRKSSARSVAFTEFCQGRTTRWGLAWSFLNINLRLYSGPSKIKVKRNKGNPPAQFVLPNIQKEYLNDVIHTTKTVLTGLKIKYNEEIVHSSVVIFFKAYKNTWSHQRRERRLFERQGKYNTVNVSKNNEVDQDHEESVNGECSEPKKPKLEIEIKTETNTEEICYSGEPIAEGSIIYKIENSSIILEMLWTGGCKQSFHQIFQYFKNYWRRTTCLDKKPSISD